MHYLISLFYFFFVCIVFILALFIVYHLRRFSIDKAFAQKQIAIFLLIGGILLSFNIIFFLLLPWQDIIRYLEI